MKSKMICLLIVLFVCSLAASPNRCMYTGTACTGKQKTPVRPGAVGTAVMTIEEIDILPSHFFMNL